VEQAIDSHGPYATVVAMIVNATAAIRADLAKDWPGIRELVAILNVLDCF
jgi:hypothetical protein